MAALAALTLPDYECYSAKDPPEPEELTGRTVYFWSADTTRLERFSTLYGNGGAHCLMLHSKKDFGVKLGELYTGDAVHAFIVKQAKAPAPILNGKDRGVARTGNGHDEATRGPAPGHAVTVAGTEPLTGELQPFAHEHEAWDYFGLTRAPNGRPWPNVDNAIAILRGHPATAKHIWHDSFTQRCMLGEQEFTDKDARALTWKMQHECAMPTFSRETVSEAVRTYAEAHAINPLTQWLDSLTWDGTVRRNHWLEDCLGVARTPFSVAAGRNWLIMMVARAYRPGCQVDHMPILEGRMGYGKSSALNILGGAWYAELKFGAKDFMQSLEGRWLIEIADLHGFGTSDHQDILATITRREDRFRSPYKHFVEDHKRTCVFVGSSETADYLQDPRGRRRFWPLECTHVNTELLSANREQYFAEAVQCFRAGESWHEVPQEESESLQMSRLQEDPWTETVRRYLASTLPNYRISSAAVLTTVIEVPLKDQSDGMKRRISNIMRSCAWEQKVEKIEGSSVKMWRRST